MSRRQPKRLGPQTRRQVGSRGTLYDRAVAEYVADSKIKFTWKKCGHTEVVDFAKKPLTKRLSASAAKMMASWWSEAKGGCIAECKKCLRAERRKAKEQL